MENEDRIIDHLIKGGLIGATLGALISDDQQKGATIGAIAGAVLFATFKANEAAKKTKVPFLVQENNVLYEVGSDGEKHFVRDVAVRNTILEPRFKLK